MPILAIVGPTAVGKSDLSVALAHRVGGEVVNTDSMQLYRGMDVGTAKLPVDERRGVPHHLLDLLEVTQSASVAEFQRLAHDVIADCRLRRVVPVLVGGSALYTRAVLDQFEFPGTDPVVRESYQRQLDEIGPEQLHRRLAEVDPEAAARIIPSNGRRIVRALEVVHLTGKPFSARLPQHTYLDPDTVQIGLDCSREELDRRIELRVRRMWDAGLVEEVRRLATQGLSRGLTASRALGYQQVLAFLAGACTEQEAFDATVRGTRRFARRQDSWFRKDPRIRWLPWDAPDLVDQAVAAASSQPLRGPVGRTRPAS